MEPGDRPGVRLESWSGEPGGARRSQADAVSAETQVKMEDALKLWNIPTISECPDIVGSSTTTTNGPNHGPVQEDPCRSS